MTKTARSGSTMSSKQLARTVVDGKKVTFYVAGQESIEGYLCGMDDFHWLVITPEGTKHLIHKGSASVIDLHDHPTFDSEPARDELDRVVSPFRRRVEADYFGRPIDVRASASGNDKKAINA